MRKTVLLLASVALGMVVLGGVAWAANIKCPNAGIERNPTPSGHQIKLALCKGTEKADTMRGTKHPDRMIGKSGADSIYGGGNGWYDFLYGGPGPDKIYGGQDADILAAGAGVDRLYGQGGWDSLSSGELDRTDDYYYGGDGNDRFSVGGTNGVDRIYGGTGNDGIHVEGNAATGAKEIVDCGPGTEDWVFFDEGVDVVMNCEFLNTVPPDIGS